MIHRMIRRQCCFLVVISILFLISSIPFGYDLDNDGYEDLVISNTHPDSDPTPSVILWGSSSGLFNNNLRTDLDNTLRASGNTVFDLNGDGYLDIIIAVRYDPLWGHTTSFTNSLIFYGNGSRNYTTIQGLPTEGASGVSVGDLNKDGYPDIVFSNSGHVVSKNSFEYETNSIIYWGASTGFSTSHTTELPTLGCTASAICDLNKDGYPDIIFANFRTDGPPYYYINSYIYWGSANGFSVSNRSGLATCGAQDVSVADLNRDGYYDIVFSNNDPNANVTVESYIYWGSASGYSTSRRTSLPTSHASGNCIADVNGDGYLDIIFCNSSDDNYETASFIYYGASDGSFSISRRGSWATVGATGVAVADVNRDGIQDVIFTNTRNTATWEINSIIYYGNGGTCQFGTNGATGVTAGDNSAFGQNLTDRVPIDIITAKALDNRDTYIKFRGSRYHQYDVYYYDGPFSNFGKTSNWQDWKLAKTITTNVRGIFEFTDSGGTGRVHPSLVPDQRFYRIVERYSILANDPWASKDVVFYKNTTLYQTSSYFSNTSNFLGQIGYNRTLNSLLDKRFVSGGAKATYSRINVQKTAYLRTNWYSEPLVGGVIVDNDPIDPSSGINVEFFDVLPTNGDPIENPDISIIPIVGLVNMSEYSDVLLVLGGYKMVSWSYSDEVSLDNCGLIYSGFYGSTSSRTADKLYFWDTIVQNYDLAVFLYKDTAKGISEWRYLDGTKCTRKLKPGEGFLIKLYYRSNCIIWRSARQYPQATRNLNP